MKYKPHPAGHLGIVDWGIGGLGIYKLARTGIGDFPVTYFSDTGVTPYGKMSQRELISRLTKVIAFLRSQGVTHILFGCNAASTAIPFLNSSETKLAGVIEAALRVTVRMHPSRLAIIGGRRTVLSGVYRRAFAERRVAVRQRIAQPLSGLIENGETHSSRLREECRKILLPIRKCSHLLLACTHYSAIVSDLREFVSTGTIIIDPSDEIVNQIAQWRLPAGGRQTFITSGDTEKMKQAAFSAFGIRLARITRVDI